MYGIFYQFLAIKTHFVYASKNKTKRADKEKSVAKKQGHCHVWGLRSIGMSELHLRKSCVNLNGALINYESQFTFFADKVKRKITYKTLVF